MTSHKLLPEVIVKVVQPSNDLLLFLQMILPMVVQILHLLVHVVVPRHLSHVANPIGCICQNGYLEATVLLALFEGSLLDLVAEDTPAVAVDSAVDEEALLEPDFHFALHHNPLAETVWHSRVEVASDLTVVVYGCYLLGLLEADVLLIHANGVVVNWFLDFANLFDP